MVESDQAGESGISTLRMSDSGLAQRAQEWLSSSRHVNVPSNWVEACVAWVLQEGSRAPVSQAYVNEQALEQWLYTDLRVLAHPVLPPLGRVTKTELSGIFCVQMNSVLDISRPAYVQLQQRRGTDCSNDQVAAVTQATQRPWEASPVRMLMLQLTDGVQDVEALEYKPVPTLNADLPPGTKLLLQGVLQCRLGVLLLTPDNVRVLGGAVEELQVALSQSRVLARILDLPEEEQPAAAAPEGESGRRDVDVSDEELLASLEVAADSGYGSRNEQPLPSPAVQHSVTVADIDEDFDDLPLDELDSVIFLEDSNPALEVEPDVIEVEPEPVEVEPRISSAGSKSVVESRTSRVGRESLEVELIASSVGRESVRVEPRTSRVGRESVEAEQRTSLVRRESVEVEPRASRVGRETVEVELRASSRCESMGVEPRTSRVRRESVEAEPRTSRVGRESVEVEPRASRVGREAVEVELRASSGCESMVVEPRTSQMGRDLARAVPKASSIGCEPVEAEPRTSRMGYESVEAEPRTSRAGCDSVEAMARANGTGCEPGEVEPRTSWMSR
ncbi:hypothetical protein GJAV_G00026690, partial [Gymnothorax javanicus]